MRGRPVSILISVTILMLIIAFIAPGGGHRHRRLSLPANSLKEPIWVIY